MSAGRDAVDEEVMLLVRHLVVDWCGVASRDHIEDLFGQALATSRYHAFLSVVLTCSLCAHVMRATFLAQAGPPPEGHEHFFGLQESDVSDADRAAAPFRGKALAMRVITTQMNDDRETASALVMAAINDGPAGVELLPYALRAALDVFRGLYQAPDSRATINELGILRA